MIWIARTLLAGLLAVTLYGAISPTHQPWMTFGRDEVEHAVFTYLIMLLLMCALPSVRLAVLAAPLLVAGVGLELGQALGWIAGSFEPGDAVANVVGLAAALAPISAHRLRPRLARRRS